MNPCNFQDIKFNTLRHHAREQGFQVKRCSKKYELIGFLKDRGEIMLNINCLTLGGIKIIAKEYGIKSKGSKSMIKSRLLEKQCELNEMIQLINTYPLLSNTNDINKIVKQKMAILALNLIPIFQTIFTTEISKLTSLELFFNISTFLHLSYHSFKNKNSQEFFDCVSMTSNFSIYINVIYKLITTRGSHWATTFSQSCYINKFQFDLAIERLSNLMSQVPCRFTIESRIMYAIGRMEDDTFDFNKIEDYLILTAELVNVAIHIGNINEFELGQDNPVINLEPYKDLINTIRNTPMISINNTTCVICLEQIKDKGYTSKCKHPFHRDCIVEYIEKSAHDNIRETCPMCRQKL